MNGLKQLARISPCLMNRSCVGTILPISRAQHVTTSCDDLVPVAKATAEETITEVRSHIANANAECFAVVQVKGKQFKVWT